jgi:hypothetical protein
MELIVMYLRIRSFVAVLLGLLPLASLLADNAADSESRLRETVSFLASDDLQGRGVGSPGIDKAADFLAQQFSKLGLRTDLFNGTPFQEFEMTLASELGPEATNRLSFVGPQGAGGHAKPIELKLSESFTPLAIGASAKIDLPLVFASFGITAKDLKRGDEKFTYDDYAKIDAKGKAVIIIRKEPQQKDKNSPFDGDKNSQYAPFVRKIENAVEHGAAAIIFVNDAAELSGKREENTKLLKAALDKLSELREELSKTSLSDEAFQKAATAVSKAAADAAELSKALASGGDSLLPFAGAGTTAGNNKIPIFFATRAAIDQLLAAAGQKDLATLERGIDADLTPRSVELAGWKAQGESNVVEKKTTVKNVVAVLDGAGPLANETIVIGAHYDHLGFGGDGSLAPWTTDIHNGADDNASGTATLLEVAHRLATSGKKPNRRIVFIAFTGEEKGLYGSAHYVRQPRFPLENTIAMFNLDMVGRLTDDKFAVYGTGTAKEFDPLVEKLSEQFGFKLTKHAGGYGPSDHNSFYAKHIPVLHLFTGTHSDYHRPSDDTEKLNIAGMRRVADFLIDVVQATDSTTARPSYVEIRKVESISGPAEGDRPSFGSMPAYPNPVKDGVLLEAVLEGTAADKAGIKGGDVLTKFGDDKITILEDFEGALRKHKPGDKVKVTVRRGTEIIEAEVTLGRRRSM